MDVTALDVSRRLVRRRVLVRDARASARSAAAVREAARVLRPGGVYVVSTPRADRTCSSRRQSFPRGGVLACGLLGAARRELRERRALRSAAAETRRHRTLRRLDVLGLRRRFALLRRASALTGTPQTTEVTLSDIVIEPDALDGASEVVAVCRLADALLIVTEIPAPFRVPLFNALAARAGRRAARRLPRRARSAPQLPRLPRRVRVRRRRAARGRACVAAAAG